MLNINVIDQIYIPYRRTLFIGINVREIRNSQNRKKFKPTKTYFQHELFA